LRLATPCHQWQGGIAGVPLRVITPFCRPELSDFRAQPVGVDRQCQANERLRELHLLNNGRPNRVVAFRDVRQDSAAQCITGSRAKKVRRAEARRAEVAADGPADR